MIEENKSEKMYTIPALTKAEFAVLVIGVLNLSDGVLNEIGQDALTAQKKLEQAITDTEGKLP